jgi:hypothetical protein
MTRRQALRALGVALGAAAGTWVLFKIGQLILLLVVPVAVGALGVGFAMAFHRFYGLPGTAPRRQIPANDVRVETLYALDQSGVVDLLPPNERPPSGR